MTEAGPRSSWRRSGGPAWFMALAILMGVTVTDAQTLEGFGAGTPGGAGQAVVRVTNLNSSGPGSLREAVSRGNRTVVFDVGGEILLTDYVYVLGAFVTIDGSTAPPPGITLRNRGLIIRGNRGAHDVIVRHIRVRDSAIDGIQVAYGAYNVMIDHVSTTGSMDGNIDVTENSHDVTVSWSVLGGNVKNMLVKYKPSRITLHHNVFTESVSRNPQLRIDDGTGVAAEISGDLRNNVVANWKAGYGTFLNHGVWANVVNNYYTGAHKALSLASARAYVAGNVSADGVDLNRVGTEESPFSSAPVTTQDACAAARLVLAGAGARPLDSIDQQYLARIPAPSCRGASSSKARPAPWLSWLARQSGGVFPRDRLLAASHVAPSSVLRP
jgi:pectate lyase